MSLTHLPKINSLNPGDIIIFPDWIFKNYIYFETSWERQSKRNYQDYPDIKIFCLSRKKMFITYISSFNWETAKIIKI